MKYFGTDGFRGQVGQQLTPLHAFQIGRFLGDYYTNKHVGKRAKVLIGKDTRLSGDTLEHALASGAAASGCGVYLIGVCPTPAISYLVREQKYDFGVMISASHNPYMDNGIKVFDASGFKLAEQIEQLVEDYIDGKSTVEWAHHDAFGRIFDIHREGLHRYADWLAELVPTRLDGMHVILDLANGSATAVAKDVIAAAGATVSVMADQPDGYNINTNCGSTHLNHLQTYMKQHPDFHIGLAFDGDADRLLAVDEQGNLVDGDLIMYLCANHLKEQGCLHDNTLVTTVMSNIGLFKALEQLNIRSEVVQVGDKYVSQCMFEQGYSIGGEQSGHIIFGNEAVTGDGLLTALHLLEIVKLSGKPLSVLTKQVKIFPQLLKNVRVKDKQAVLKDTDLLAKVEEVKQQLGDNGRILVRPSGTEQLIRVMVEAATDELCDDYVSAVTEILEKKGL